MAFTRRPTIGSAFAFVCIAPKSQWKSYCIGTCRTSRVKRSPIRTKVIAQSKSKIQFRKHRTSLIGFSLGETNLIFLSYYELIISYGIQSQLIRRFAKSNYRRLNDTMLMKSQRCIGIDVRVTTWTVLDCISGRPTEKPNPTLHNNSLHLFYLAFESNEAKVDESGRLASLVGRVLFITAYCHSINIIWLENFSIRSVTEVGESFAEILPILLGGFGRDF